MIGSAIGLVLYRRIFQRDEWRQQRQQTRALMPKSYWHVYWGVWGLWFPLGIFLTITHRQEYTFLSNLLYAMWGFLFVPLAYRQAKQWKYLAASFWAGMGIFMLWLTWSNIVETKRGCMKYHVEQDNLNNARFPANVHLTPDTNPSLGCKIVYATLKAIPHDQKPSFGVCIKGVCKTVGIIDLPEVPTEYNSPPHPWGFALPQRPTPYEALVVCENGACRTEMRPRKE